MSNKAKTGSTVPAARADLAERFDAAITWRVAHHDVTFAQLAEVLGMDITTLGAKRRGKNKIFFEEIEAADEYFAALGSPGLVDEVRQARRWLSQPIDLAGAKLPAPARKLLEAAPGLREAGANIHEFLAERGLLKHVHIMVRADEAIRTTHCGGSMASADNLDRSILGRDVRSLSDRPYGQFLHSQVSELIQMGRPDLRRISSPIMRYTRLGVVAGEVFIGCSFDIEVSRKYVLR